MQNTCSSQPLAPTEVLQSGRSRGSAVFRLALTGAVLATTLTLAGCGGGVGLPSLSGLNPFKEEEKILPGERKPILTATEAPTTNLAVASTPVTLPQPVANSDWSQPGGNASNTPGHLALQAALQQTWTADIGSGSSSDGKLTVSPIVAGGRIFTMDTEGRVSAFSASGGSRQWRTSLVPEFEDEEAGFGGGLAASDGLVFAATGFGTVAALKPSTGAKQWERALGVPIRTSPTAADGRVIVTTTDGVVHALNVLDGGPEWTMRGLPQSGGLLSNVSPAVANGVVVVPFPSGDVVALDASTGNRIWSESLARARQFSLLSSMSDPGRPAIDGDAVYAVGHSGRMIATSARTGERLWSQNIRGIQTPYVAGDGVYVVDTGGKLLAMSKSDGAIRWATQLPGGGVWSGPVLAGGQLWLASNEGKLVSADGVTGRITGTKDLGQPVYIAPVVASGQMFVLTDSARLIALR